MLISAIPLFSTLFSKVCNLLNMSVSFWFESLKVQIQLKLLKLNATFSLLFALSANKCESSPSTDSTNSSRFPNFSYLRIVLSVLMLWKHILIVKRPSIFVGNTQVWKEADTDLRFGLCSQMERKEMPWQNSHKPDWRSGGGRKHDAPKDGLSAD